MILIMNLWFNIVQTKLFLDIESIINSFMNLQFITFFSHLDLIMYYLSLVCIFSYFLLSYIFLLSILFSMICLW